VCTIRWRGRGRRKAGCRSRSFRHRLVRGWSRSPNRRRPGGWWRSAVCGRLGRNRTWPGGWPVSCWVRPSLGWLWVRSGPRPGPVATGSDADCAGFCRTLPLLSWSWRTVTGWPALCRASGSTVVGVGQASGRRRSRGDHQRRGGRCQRGVDVDVPGCMGSGPRRTGPPGSWPLLWWGRRMSVTVLQW
jgi:hypothetical protein